ncbi:hypothetical protein FQN57_002486, partial [Myotisia sp. PD_48]
MVLRAAISHYQNSRGTRDGSGYWRHIRMVKYHDELGAVLDLTYITELGACMPVKSSGGGVLSATGAFDSNGNHLKEPNRSLGLESLDIESPSDTMPVWIYGNWWAESQSKEDIKSSKICLVGIGARFGQSQSHFDVFGGKKGDVKLCGSTIAVSTT